MKSRLEPAPLTVEDESVLAFISWHLYDGIQYRMDVYRDTDRHDADLMLALTRARNGLRNLKKTVQTMYDGLTPHEQDVMRRLWGTRRPE